MVNLCLNYGYSMLYPRVWQALILIPDGLNPGINYLHKEQDGKPTLPMNSKGMNIPDGHARIYHLSQKIQSPQSLNLSIY
ncbi:MAG TPA: hypothetical protein ENH01_07590 [Nitrospirae bacterium]|nr:hypothetical protein [Nitrospirota bacterium]